MVEITTRAEELLLRLRSERGFERTDGARFVTEGGRIRLTFSPAPKPGDRILDGARLPIFVEGPLSDRLLRKTIDSETSEGKTRLIIRRNRQAGSTGGDASRI